MQPVDESLDDAYTGSSLESTGSQVVRRVIPRSLKLPSMRLAVAVVVFFLMVGAGSVLLLGLHANKQPGQDGTGGGVANFAVGNLSTTGLSPAQSLQIGQADHLTINGQLQVTNALVLTPSAAPQSPVAGQIYFDSNTKTPYYFNGAAFVSLKPTAIPQSVTSLGGAAGTIALGNGLAISGNQLALSGTILQEITNANVVTPKVTSLQGLTGDITLTGGSGITVSGTTITNSGVVSLSSSDGSVAITNNGNGSFDIKVVSGGSGNTAVLLGPPAAQTDSSTNSSLHVDKTAAGDFLELASNGVDKFVVDQTGAITAGTINYSQVQGAPATTVTSIGGVSGAISLGSGLNISGGTLSNTGVVNVAGTANQVFVSAATGNVTLSLPQDIATSSSPTFTNQTLTGNLSVHGGLTVGVAGSAAGVLSLANSSNGNLSQIQSAAPSGTGTATYTLPSIAGGTSANLCLDTGNCAGSGGGVITSGGTTNTLALFTGSNTIGDSVLSQSAGNLIDSGALTVQSGGLTVSAGGITVSGNSSIAGSLAGLTGLSSSGTITFSGLSTAGVVHNSAGGVLSTGPVVLGTDTSGNYVGSLGALTGLSLGGTNGVAGAVPTLAVSYGSSANTAVQGNTTLVCPSGTGNLTGGGNTIALGAGGTCSGITIVNGPVFSGNLSVQGVSGISVGVIGTTNGQLVLNSSNIGGSFTIQASTAQANTTTITVPTDTNATDTICLQLLANCSASGNAGGDLTGTYPNPTIAKLQGTTITVASLTSGQILQYNGTAWINQTITGDVTISSAGVTTIGAGKVTNADLQNSSLSVTAGSGLGGGGSVALGGSTTLSVAYGSGANTSVQGNTTLVCPTGTGNLTGGGNTITLGAGGSCNNLTVVNSPTFSGSLTVQGSGGITVGVAGTTSGQITINSVAGGSFTVQASNGQTSATTITLPTDTNATDTVCLFNLANCSATGNAGGDLTGTYPNPTIAKLQGSTLTIATPAGGDLLLYDGTAFVNKTVTGDVTINSSGVTTIGAGKVTNADLVNSSLSVTAGNGLSGGGSVSLGGSTSLSVAYGSAANTAVQGNTTLVCPSGSGNLTGGGNIITLGAGGSCNNLTVVNSPTFSGNLTVQGASGVTVGVAGTTAGVISLANGTNSNLSNIQSAAPSGTGNATYTLPSIAGGTSANLCLDTGNCTAAGNAGGDLTGTYPNPTIAKLQGVTLTVGSPSGGDLLLYNGTAFVNQTVSGDVTINSSGVTAIGAGKVTNADLQNSSLSVVAGTNLSGGGSVSLGSSVTLNVSSSPTFSGNVTVQGASGVAVGSTTNTGVLSFLDGTADGFNGTVKLSGALTANQSYLLPTTGGTFCLNSGNCTAAGNAGGDLTGTYPNPTIAKLQGSTLTIATPAGGDLLLYDGTAFVNKTVTGDVTINSSGVTTIGAGKVTNADLVNSSLSVTAGNGLSGGGSVSLGGSTSLSVAYGSAANTAVQGNTTLVCPSGSGNLTGGGNTITLGAGGTCSGITIVNNPTFSGLLTDSSATTGLALTGTPALSATSALAELGSAIASGNANGTYIGINEPVSGNGSASDFLDFENNGSVKLKVSSSGALTEAGGLTVQSGGITVTGNSTIAGTLGSLTGLSSSGPITFSGLNTAGIVHNNASGQLSTGAVVLGTDTSGNYVGSLGSATGLTIGGTNGVAGAVPTLTVNYGSAASTAVQGNTTLVCPSGSGNLTGGGNTITLGAGGTCSGITLVNSPTLSGNLTVQGASGVTVGSTVNNGVLSFLDGTADGFSGTIKLGGAIAANQTYTLPATGGTICLANSSACGFETTSGTDFIRNQTTVQSPGNFYIRSGGTGSVAGVLEGANGQTADLLDLNSYNGTTSSTVAKFDKSGNLTAANFSGSSSGANTGDVSLAGTASYLSLSGQALTQNAINLGTAANITGTLPVGNGGTGVNGSTAANGALLIGNGSGFSLANLTQGSNISITNSAGGITVATVASPSFTSATLGTTSTNGALNFLDGTADGFSGALKLSGALSANQTYSLPTTGGTICLNTNNCGYQASGSYELTTGTDFVRNQTSQQTGANFNIQARASSVAAVIQGASGQDIMDLVASGGSTVAKIDASGNLTAVGGNFSGSLEIGTGTATGALQVDKSSYTSNLVVINNGRTGAPSAYPGALTPTLSVVTNETSGSRPLFFGYDNGSGGYGAYLTSGACGSFTVMCFDLGSGTSTYTALANNGTTLDLGGGSGTDGNFTNVSFGNSGTVSIGSDPASGTTAAMKISGLSGQSYGLIAGPSATSTGAVAIQGLAAQSGDLLDFRDSSGILQSSFNGTGQLTLGTIAASGTVYQGQLTLSDGTTDGFGVSLKTATQANNVALTIPADTHATDTICLQTLGNCGGIGTAFIQNGNAFGVQAVLGTTDNNSLAFKTNNTIKAVLDTSGNFTFQQASTVGVLAASSGVGYNLTIAAGTSGTGANNGGNLILQGGATGGTGTTGTVVVKANGTNSTNVFQVQNATGTALLNSDTTNMQIDVGSLATPSTITAMLAPAAPSVTPTGTAGSTTYAYEVTAVSNYGLETLASSATSIATGNATLDGTNYNAISWTAVTGAARYNIYRTSGGNGQGLVGSTTATTFNDTGFTAAYTAVPNSAASGSLTASTTYYYEVTAVDGTGGQTIASPEVSLATNATYKNIALSWAAIPGARAYNVYRGTASGSENAYQTVATNGFIDTGLAGTAATPPTTATAYANNLGNNARQALTVGNLGTPTSQLYVAGQLPQWYSGSTTNGLNGNETNVVTMGKYAYVATGTNTGTLQVYDISNPASPTLIGSSPSLGVVTSVSYLAISGGYAYVGNVSGGGSPQMVILSLSNPTSPTIVSKVSVGDTVNSIAISGHYAYLARSGWLYIYDVSNPYHPVQVYANNDGADSYIVVKGNYAYVISNCGNMLILDISNPAAPVPLGNYAFVESGSGCFDSLSVSGRYAYVTSRTTSNGETYIETVDISNPAAPVNVGILGLGIEWRGAGSVIQGQYLYLNTVNVGVIVASLANPASPTVIGTFGPSAYGPPTVNGRYAYLVSGSTLYAYDLGGSYIQQLQSGDLQTSTLQVDGASNFTGDVNLQGNLTDGGTIQTAGGVTSSGPIQAAGSNISALGLGTPSITNGPSWASNQGGNLSGSSSVTYYYRYTYKNMQGESVASNEVSFNGGNFPAISAPATAPTATAAAGSSLGIGAYLYEVTYTTANGETTGSSEASVTTTSGNQNVNLTNVPIGPTGTTSRKIYRTAVGGASGTEKYVGTIADNTTTTFSDTVADGSLGAALPGGNSARTNTNQLNVYFDSGSGDTVRIYRGTSSGGENVYFDVSGFSPWTDTGAAGTAGTPPSMDSTGILSAATAVHVGSIGTPTSQLYVAGQLPQWYSGSTTNGLTSGATSSVAVSGKYAYVGSANNNGSIEVYDISDPNNPALVGSSATMGNTGGTTLKISGGWLYVINGSNHRLYIFSLSNPTTPVQVYARDMGDTPQGLAISGHYLYVARNSWLYIYDVSNPYQPVQVYANNDGANSTIVVQGRYAYVRIGNPTFLILDVSDPANPVQVGSYSSTYSNGGASLSVLGHYAYLGVSDSSCLDYVETVDLSDPTTPTKVNDLNVGCNRYTYGSLIQGHYLYMNEQGSAQLIDISNPAAPANVGYFGVSTGGIPAVEGRYLYAEANNTLYAYDLGGSYIQQLQSGDLQTSTLQVDGTSNFTGDVNLQGNLTDGGTIQTAGGVTSSGPIQASGANIIAAGLGTPTLSTSSNPYYVANQGGTLSGSSSVTYYYRMTYTDLQGEGVGSNEIAFNGGSFTPISAPATAPTATAAAGSSLGIGAYLYEVTYTTANGETTGSSEASVTTTSGNQNVNLTNVPIGPTGTTSRKIYRTAVGGATGTEKYVGTIADNTTTTFSDTVADGSLGAAVPGSNTARTNTNELGIYFNGNNVKIYRGTSSGGENVYFDVNSSPFIDTGAAGTAGTPPLQDSTGILSATTAVHVGGLGTATSQLYIGGQAPGWYSGKVNLTGSGTNVVVRGNYAYLGTGYNSGTFYVYDVSNPNSPVLIGTSATLPTAGYGISYVAVSGNYAFVGSNNYNFWTIDISNPANPVVVGNTAVANRNIEDIAVSGHYAYVSDGGTLYVYDIINPTAPTQLYSNNDGADSAIAISGKYAYVIANGSTMLILDISNPASPTQVGSFTLTHSGGPNTISVNGRYAYVGSDNSNIVYLETVDVSNPASPVSLNVVSPGGWVGLAGSNIQGRYLYLTLGSFIDIYDLANPAAPSSTGTFGLSGADSAPDLQGRYLYAIKNGQLFTYDLGGAYIQQLHAGGIQTTTLRVDGSTSIGGDAAIQGSLTTSGSIQSAGGMSTTGNVNIEAANLTLSAFVKPSAPTLTVGSNQGGSLSGAAGTTYYYQISDLNANGESVGSSEASFPASSFTPISAPATGPTAAPAAGTDLGVGAYLYEVTYTTANGETTGSPETSVTTTASNQDVSLTNIPTGPTGTTSRKIYRTAVGGATGTEKYVGTIADNTTTTYTDTTPDASLGAAVPSSNTAITNTNNISVAFTTNGLATSYRIYRGTTSGGENVYFTATSSPFTDTGAAGAFGTPQTIDGTGVLAANSGSIGTNLTVGKVANILNYTTTPTVYTYNIAPYASTSGLSVNWYNSDSVNYKTVGSGTLAYSGTDGPINWPDLTTSRPAGVNTTYINAKWTGYVRADYTTTYTFCTTSDDGSYLYISGTLIVNNWFDQAPTQRCGTVNLTAGSWYPIEVDYYQGSGGATMEAYWSTTYFAQQLIPASNLSTYSGSSLPASLITLNTSTSTGSQVTVKTATNSTAGFQVQNASSSSLLVGDTTNMRVGVDVSYTAMASPSISATATASTGGSLAQNTTYYYEVTALDASGGETAPSVQASQLTGNTTTTNTITLTWAPVSGAAGYRVYRSTTSGSFSGAGYYSTVGTVSGSNLTFTDTGAGLNNGSATPPATTTAYAASNVSNTNNLELSVGGNGQPTGQVYVSGTLPTSPVSTTPLSGTGSVYTQGGYAYTVVASATNTFEIYDVSNPVVPTLVSAVSLPSVGSGGSQVIVQGKYAYINANGVLYIYDISNPYSPTQVSSYGASVTPTDIFVSGNYEYVSGSNTLVILNITNPASPVIISRTASPGGSFKVVGRYAYVISPDPGSQLQILDVSNPYNPVQVYSTTMPSITQGIVVQGRYAYVGMMNNFDVLDITNPASPVVVGTNSSLGNTGDLWADGQYLYQAATGASIIKVISISSPNLPTVMGTISLGSSNSASVYAAGRYLYATTGFGGAYMDIFDLGGEYAQSLQAQTGQIGSLQVDTNAQVTGDTNVGGSLNVGQTLQAGGNVGISGAATIQGSTVLDGGSNRLSPPTQNAVTFSGSAGGGAVTWTYVVTAVNAYGGETTVSNTQSIAAPSSSNSTLNSGNYNVINWNLVSGATAYKIYRTAATGGSPSSTGLIGSLANSSCGATCSFDDTGLGATGTSSPTINTTGQLTVAGSELLQTTTNSTTAFQVQDASSNSLFIADTTDGKVIIGSAVDCGASSNTILTPDGIDMCSVGGNTHTTLTQQSNGAFLIQPSSHGLAIEPASDSTTAFQVQNAGATINELTVNSSTNQVQIGSSTGNTNGVLLALNNYNATLGTEPTEVDGAMYYNSTLSTFRCGVAGAWENCGGLSISNTATSSCTVALTSTACAVPNNYFTSAAPTIPANYCVPGRVIHVIINGTYVGNSTTTTMTFSLHLGSATLATSGAITDAVTTQQWKIDDYITCDSSTTVTSEGTVMVATSGAAATTGALTNTGTTTVTNTSAQAIVPYVAVGATTPMTSITIQQFIVQGQ